MPYIHGFPPEIERARAKATGTPLMLGISAGPGCNIGCVYCNRIPTRDRLTKEIGYTTYIPKRRIDDLSLKEYFHLFRRAKASGIRYVKISRVGEPFLDPLLRSTKPRRLSGAAFATEPSYPLIDYGCQLGLRFLIYSNARILTNIDAESLATRAVSIVTKLGSLNKAVDNRLKGIRSSEWVLHKGVPVPEELKRLMDAGFNEPLDGCTRLGINVITTKENLDDVPRVVEFASENNIWAEIELLAPQGSAWRLFESLAITDEENRTLFKEIKRRVTPEYFDCLLEREETAHNECAIMQSGIYIDTDGSVRVCSDIPGEFVGDAAKIGDVRKETLEELFAKSLTARKDFLPEHRIRRSEIDRFYLCTAGLYSKELYDESSVGVKELRRARPRQVTLELQ